MKLKFLYFALSFLKRKTMEPAASVKINYTLSNDELFETEVKIYDYTEKSVAVEATEHFGRAFTDKLKDLANYNPKLKFGKGWVLSKKKYPELQKLMTQISEGKIKGNIPPEAPRRRSICMMTPLLEPPIVSSFKNIKTLILESKQPKNVYVCGENSYVWGKKDIVYAHVASNGKKILMEYSLDDNVLIML